MNRRCMIQVGVLLVWSVLTGGLQTANAESQPVLRNFWQVLTLPQQDAQQGASVSVLAWVLATDPETGVVLLRDPTDAWELKLPKQEAGRLQPGQRLRVEAKTRWDATHAGLDAVRLLDQAPATAPKQISPGERAESPYEMEWAEVEGTVMFAGVAGDELVLDVAQRGQHLSAHVANCGFQNVSGLLHSRVRILGLAQGCLTADGETAFGQMWVADLEEIQLVEPTIQEWQSCPALTADELRKIIRDDAAMTDATDGRPAIGSRIRISGRIEKADEHGYELRDPSGTVIVTRSWADDLKTGTEAEVLGILARRDDQPVLYCAWFKAGAPKPGELPVLTTIEQIHRLNTEEADRGYPVRVRGVATGGFAYIQDGTRGISVSNGLDHLTFGCFYEVEGKTGAGL